jgi:hypothetical protein
MANITKKEFVARTKYHHSQRTSEHVTFLVYKDSGDAYELIDDREPASECLAGSKEYIFEEWGNRNRQLVHDGFQLDSKSGDNEWQRFIS